MKRRDYSLPIFYYCWLGVSVELKRFNILNVHLKFNSKMSTKIKEEPDNFTFEPTSELILDNCVVKVEADSSYKYHEIVDSQEIKVELDNVRSGKSPVNLFVSAKNLYVNEVSIFHLKSSHCPLPRKQMFFPAI